MRYDFDKVIDRRGTCAIIPDENLTKRILENCPMPTSRARSVPETACCRIARVFEDMN